MQVQRISNNNYNKQNFGARYIVKGNITAVRAFYEQANKFIKIKGEGNLMLHYNPDIMLVCTDEASRNAMQKFQNKCNKNPNKLYPEFRQLPLNIQLQKIFRHKHKQGNIIEYNAKDILNNPDFDVVEGIIK